MPTPTRTRSRPPSFELGVIICGVYRSASTWSYNVVREGGIRQKLVLRQPVNHTAVESESGGDVALLKFHYMEPEEMGRLSSFFRHRKVVVTLRPAVECVGSMMKTFSFDFDTAFQEVRKSFAFAATLVNNKSLVLPYRDVSQRPMRSCFNVLRYVYGSSAAIRHTVPVWMATRRQKLAKLSSAIPEDSPQTCHLGWSYFDKDTLLHRRHVSLTDADYRSAFSAEQCKRIEGEVDGLVHGG